MSPEAVTLAERRIRTDLKEAERQFAHRAAQRSGEFSIRGVGTSSMMIIAIHELARAELVERALSAWRTVQRLIAADDAQPSDESRSQAIDLCQRAVGELSADIDAVYAKYSSQMQGTWPTIEEPRARAMEVACSEIDIDFLARRRKRLPLDDVLRTPRYQAVYSHWRRASDLASGNPPDVANAIKEGTLAIESLAKVVLAGKCSTLGECVKLLRSRKLIDPGMDKILEGVWTYSSATPGIRHGGTTSPSFAEYDWVVLKPMIDAALHALLLVDVSGAV